MIFLQHSVISENCEKFIQILPATRSRMYNVNKRGNTLGLDTLDSYPVHYGVIEGLVTSLCQASNRLRMFINTSKGLLGVG